MKYFETTSYKFLLSLIICTSGNTSNEENIIAKSKSCENNTDKLPKITTIRSLNSVPDTIPIRDSIYYLTNKPKQGDKKLLRGIIFSFMQSDEGGLWGIYKKSKVNNIRIFEDPTFVVSYEDVFKNIIDKDTLRNIYQQKVVIFDSSYQIKQEIYLDSINPHLNYNGSIKLINHYFNNEGGGRSIVASNPNMNWKNKIDQYWVNGYLNPDPTSKNWLVFIFSLTSVSNELGILNTENTILVYDKFGI